MKCLSVVLCVVLSGAGAAQACDLCAVYTATEAKEVRPGWSVGVFEQFTHFGTLRENGDEVPDAVGQRLDSSITQLIVGYQFNNRLGVQFNLPVIYRSFRRPEGFAIDTGHESGIGDASLTANVTVFQRFTEDTTIVVNVLGGLKFPTGRSDRLAEELNEIEVPGAPESGVHGHDLALGSGSTDGIIGGSVLARWKRLFASAALQYAIRSEGDFDYRYANDLTWNGGPGVYVWLSHTGTATLQFNVSGESKGTDTFQGAAAEDTGITAVYLGPEVSVTWRDRLNADVGIDLPVVQNNTAVQIVPDYRIRAAMTWRF